MKPTQPLTSSLSWASARTLAGCALFLASLSACPGEDPAAAPTPEATPRAPVSTEPGLLMPLLETASFGQVAPGQTASLELRFQNQGTENVNIVGMSLDAHQSISSDIGRVWPVTVLPGETFVQVVTFAPQADVSARGTLEVRTNNPDVPRMQVALSGDCLSPRLELPSVVAFGQTADICPVARSVDIVNEGREAAQLNRIWLTGDDLLEISLNLSENLPMVLEPGQKITAELSYQPSTEGRDSVFMHLDSSDPRGEQVAEVTGEAHETVPVSVTFQAFDKRPVDVLLMVDNSGSMCEEQETLRANLAQFMAIVESQEVPYHIGVVDVEDTALEGTPSYITPETPDKEAAFLANAYRGCNGTQGVEQGLYMANQALMEQAIYQAGVFFRPEATLKILYISDEEDQSPDTVESYVEHLRQLKLDPSDVQLTAIAGDAGTGCSSVNGNAEAGNRYYQATQLTGGKFESICLPDYMKVVSELAWDSVVDYVDKYLLPSRPDEDSIQVKIDNVSVAEDIAHGWTYDPSIRGLVLHGRAIPTGPARIDVTYREQMPCTAADDRPDTLPENPQNP